MPVALEYPKKGFLELLVGERVAERVDGAVEVAQPVGDVVEQRQTAVVGEWTETYDEREDMPRSPTEYERAEDDCDGAQSFPGAVLALATNRRRLSLRLALLTVTVARSPPAAFSRAAATRPAPGGRLGTSALTASAAASLWCRRRTHVELFFSGQTRRLERLDGLVLNVDGHNGVRCFRYSQLGAVVRLLCPLADRYRRTAIAHRWKPEVDATVDGLSSTGGTAGLPWRQLRLPHRRRGWSSLVLDID